jgi:hypothetical protein
LLIIYSKMTDTIDSKPINKSDVPDSASFNKEANDEYIKMFNRPNMYCACTMNDSTYEMNFEKNRIESFKNFPNNWMDVKELANFGFYFTGVNDCVKCNFCGIGLHKWEAIDDVFYEHKRWSPNCPLINGMHTGNRALEPKKYSTLIHFRHF